LEESGESCFVHRTDCIPVRECDQVAGHWCWVFVMLVGGELEIVLRGSGVQDDFWINYLGTRRSSLSLSLMVRISRSVPHPVLERCFFLIPLVAGDWPSWCLISRTIGCAGSCRKFGISEDPTPAKGLLLNARPLWPRIQAMRGEGRGHKEEATFKNRMGDRSRNPYHQRK
jgi:hypothetical protein